MPPPYGFAQAGTICWALLDQLVQLPSPRAHSKLKPIAPSAVLKVADADREH